MRRMKIYTRRSGRNSKPVTPIEDARILQETILGLRGNALIPRGVYRFHSFEEADQWMIKAIASTRARLQYRT